MTAVLRHGGVSAFLNMQGGMSEEQKLSCVLHEAYKDGLFDERILLLVNRPKWEQEKKKADVPF